MELVVITVVLPSRAEMGAIEKIRTMESPVCDGGHPFAVSGAQIIPAQMQRKMQETTETQSRDPRHRHDMTRRDAVLVRHLSDADASALAPVPHHGRQGDVPPATARGFIQEGGYPMINVRIAIARHAATLRRLVLALGGLVALAGPAFAEATSPEGSAPPTVVIDAEYVPGQPSSHVLYVAHEHQLLAMDTTSGAIRAVLPGPQRVAPSTFSALAAGSVSVPFFGIALLAAAFVGLVGVIFLRRMPAGA